MGVEIADHRVVVALADNRQLVVVELFEGVHNFTKPKHTSIIYCLVKNGSGQACRLVVEPKCFGVVKPNVDGESVTDEHSHRQIVHNCDEVRLAQESKSKQIASIEGCCGHCKEQHHRYNQNYSFILHSFYSLHIPLIFCALGRFFSEPITIDTNNITTK